MLKPVVVNPIICPKGHIFYPKINNDGTIKIYEKCLVRNCRSNLDRQKVKNGIKQRSKNLIHGNKPNINTKIHPKCKICDITLFDQETLDRHNTRLHKKVKK